MPPALRRQLAGCWRADGTLGPEDLLWFTRGLRRAPFAGLPQRQRRATFEWVVKPEHGTRVGAVYTDGSLLDHHVWMEGQCVALGWAFVALGSDGRVVASARGCPPPCIATIYGAELWAVLMVRRHAGPGATAIIADCQAVQKDSDRGRKWATAPCRTHSQGMGSGQSG